MICKNVLLIEDDRDIRNALEELLKSQGYVTHVAGNGKEGFDVLQTSYALNDPCIILLDLMMPIMDGWEFFRAKQADAKLASIPVVVLSAYDGDKAELSSTRFLKKPIDFETLLEVVREHCG